MTLYLDEFSYENLGTFLLTWRKSIVETCKRAMQTYGVYEENEYEDYVVLTNVEGYFCIARIINEFSPIEINDLVQPFDEERVYPAQRIEKCFCFKRW